MTENSGFPSSPEVEIFIEESNGFYSASIPSLSLMESGTDLGAVCEKLALRAKAVGRTFPELDLYAPSFKPFQLREGPPPEVKLPLRMSASQMRNLVICASTLLSIGAFFLLDFAYSALSPPFTIAEDCEGYRLPRYDHGFLAKPNCSGGWTWGGQPYPIFTDSLGFRSDRVKETPLVSDRDRIVVMGDSFVACCWAYPDTIPGKMQAKLDPKKFDIINAGNASWSPTNYYLRIHDLLQAGFRFNYLVLMIDISDIQDEAAVYGTDEKGVFHNLNGRTSREVLGTNYTPLPEDQLNKLTLDPWLRNNFRLTWTAINAINLLRFKPTTVIEDIDRAAWTYTTNPEVEKRAYGPYGIEGGIKRAEARVRQLAEDLKKYDIGLMIVVYPWPQQLKFDKVDSRQVGIHRKLAADLGAKFLDLFPTFFHLMATDPDWRKYYREGDVHFSPIGNDIVADKIIACYERAASCSK